MTGTRKPQLLLALAILSLLSFLGLSIATARGWRPWDKPTETPVENLSEEALAELRKAKPAPLSGKLSELLQQARDKPSATQAHPLLGKKAPNLALPNVDGVPVSLDELIAKGPVVLVFYLGYSCNHCVSQLFDLHEDVAYFRELGATIVAVSADSPERTRSQYAKYGPFAFPVLADAEHVVAQRYGVYAPPANGKRAWEVHGTFVIGKNGLVTWANTGDEPFTGNATLLFELAKP